MSSSATLRNVSPSTPLKGLRKAGELPLVRPSQRSGWLVSDYCVKELFERADIMSEGAWRAGDQDGGEHYFGTTSILLWTRSAKGGIPDVDLSVLATVFSSDPHVRLRAVRVACREAAVRAAAALTQVRTEVSINIEPAAIRIHIDVEARAAESRTNQRAVL